MNCVKPGRRHNPSMSEPTREQNPENPSPEVVLLVDGSSYLYRAFHAMPDLRAVP
jgi:DNA polymerase-1